MSKYFKLEKDKLVKTKKECPKCGDGFFMGEHKDRYHCGNCAETMQK